MRLIIVGCGAKKLPHPAPPAELYTGLHFRACYATAQAIQQPGDLVLVLSALHGLLRPDGYEVKPYDMTFGDPGTVTAACIRDQAQIFGYQPGARVIALCGARYVERLREAFGAGVEAPLAGQGIGTQRATLKRMREQAELDDEPSPAHVAALDGRCSHGGHGWNGETCPDISDPAPRVPPQAGRNWTAMTPAEFGHDERWIQSPMMLVPEEGMLV